MGKFPFSQSTRDNWGQMKADHARTRSCLRKCIRWGMKVEGYVLLPSPHWEVSKLGFALTLSTTRSGKARPLLGRLCWVLCRNIKQIWSPLPSTHCMRDNVDRETNSGMRQDTGVDMNSATERWSLQYDSWRKHWGPLRYLLRIRTKVNTFECSPGYSTWIREALKSCGWKHPEFKSPLGLCAWEQFFLTRASVFPLRKEGSLAVLHVFTRLCELVGIL